MTWKVKGKYACGSSCWVRVRDLCERIVSCFYNCKKFKGEEAECLIWDGMRLSGRDDAYASRDVGLDSSSAAGPELEMRWRNGKSVWRGGGGPWHWGSQPYCYFEEAKRGGLLRSVHRRMPMDLTGWPTSDPSCLLNDQIWYLTLWEWPGVTAAIPDISVKSSCLSFLLLLLFPVIILGEWENHRNAKGKGQVVLAGFRKSLSVTPRTLTAASF